MSSTYTETPRVSGSTATAEAAAYGGLIDAVGGIATIVLAIVALAGIMAPTLLAIATIVFGAALLIQGGAMASEFAQVMFPSGAMSSQEQFGSGGLSAVFLVGAAGIVLGVLALLGIAAQPLTSIAVIAFGAALVLSSNSVRQLYTLRSMAAPPARTSLHPGSEFIAGQMASGSAGVQLLAGLTAIVLGILAVAGTNAAVLTLAALLVLGATVVLTGSTLSALVIGFMRPSARTMA